MKRFKTLPVTAAALLVLGATGTGWAFHSGGVAECEGCHTMHNSLGGQQMNTATAQFTTGPYLLQGTDQSSSCLNCHQHAGDTGPSSYHISTAEADMPAGSPPLQLTPGGDFGWLKKTYSWVPRAGAATEWSHGERKGHNIVAADYNYVVDSTITAAPGSMNTPYPANQFSCISCHDPHGTYRITSLGVQAKTGKPIRSSGSYGAVPDATTAVGVYRLLGGAGYKPKSLSGGDAFMFAAPYAVAPNSYNRSEATSDTRVAYGRSMSLWCANCHGQMHTTFGTLVHPADQNLGPFVAQIYNSYKKSGNLTGVVDTAFTSLVPFQSDNTHDLNALKAQTTSTAGPISTDRVMCLSCHRAHASGFDSMMRYGLGNEFMTVADASGNPVWPDPVTNAAQAQGRTVAETQQAYYGRPPTNFAPFQRVLCNKCHAKD
ncbi:cytochrome c [Geobacter sulfurreducens subsp. ethanolicus]|uniref:cytochrome C n=1 Tax=Geobacter sulfurreducens TaxID=35554 RepID=UPI002572FBB4|nr:cytochrome C [Geobacter sulfurreducens]BEH09551.1 cytochrome c [Geobacter sulfurreducens subsp. ethanolicus]